jgi:hypothetical protein
LLPIKQSKYRYKWKVLSEFKGKANRADKTGTADGQPVVNNDKAYKMKRSP